MRMSVVPRQGLVWSAAFALIAAPVLGGCSSSRRTRTNHSTANQSAFPGNGYAMAPSAPSTGSIVDAGNVPGAPPYVDPFPGSVAPSPEGFGTFPEFEAPAPLASGETRSELDASRAEIERMKAEQAALNAELSAWRDKIASQQDALIASPPLPAGPGRGVRDVPVDGALAELESALRSSASGAEVVRQGESVVVRLTDGFRSGDDKLLSPSQADAVARATAQALARYPDARVSVVGHSDSTPIVKTKHLWRSNQHLSEARARTVADRLANAGLSSRIEVQGRGASEPLIAPEKNRADQARNRRVEIVISL